MSRSSRFMVAIAMAVSMVAAGLSAQQAQPRPQQPAQPRVQPGQPAQPGQAGQQAQPGQRMEARADSQLAACLIVDNQGEVALGKLAAERGHSQQVKRFGQQMVEDHGQFIAKLERFAGQRARAPRTDAAQPRRTDQPATRSAPDQPQANRQAQDQAQSQRPAADRPAAAGQPADRPAARGGQRGGQLDFVAIKRQIGEQCLQSARKELDAKQGREFDMCFMTMQALKHMEAIETMKVFKEHGSDEFAQVVDEGIRTAQTHLDHAKQILKQLEGEAAATARRPANN